MKIFKRTVSLFLAFCLCAGMLLLQPQSTVSAAVGVEFVKILFVDFLN